jgi:radical SAM protein (TIGR01212 family)
MTSPVPPPVHPELRFRPYGPWIRERIGGAAIRVGVDGGFSCPNREAGRAGCSYCNNDAFTPGIADGTLPVGEQVVRGIDAVARGRRVLKEGAGPVRFLAYFQRFSNTYASAETLDRRYSEALTRPDVAGLVVGTRPDCLPADVLDVLARIARDRYVMVEIGLQSLSDAVLAQIGRGHTVRQFEDAVRAVRGRGIDVGVHLIQGLPGDDREGFAAAAPFLSGLDVQGVKLHHFHVVRGTRAESEWREGSLRVPGLEAHVAACADFLERLSPGIAVMRLSGEAPDAQLLAPRWGPDAADVARSVSRELARRDAWQGKRRPDHDG